VSWTPSQTTSAIDGLDTVIVMRRDEVEKVTVVFFSGATNPRRAGEEIGQVIGIYYSFEVRVGKRRKQLRPNNRWYG
jgi:hypothetical protein